SPARPGTGGDTGTPGQGSSPVSSLSMAEPATRSIDYCPPVHLHDVGVTLLSPPPPPPPYHPLETPELRWPLSSLRGGVACVLLQRVPKVALAGSRPLPVRASQSA
ncbi:hypothetical protein H1C71_014403, partial [Ictidomys tridecemlineatus]